MTNGKERSTTRHTHQPAAADVTRYADAVAAADDPDALMDAGTDIFAEMAALARAGDRVAMARAAVTIGDICLRLCATRATSVRAAENKARFLRIMVGWAWVREPALGAVMEAALQAERRAWGDDLRWDGVASGSRAN